MTNKISTESYKGVRDFYPEEYFIQNYIFNTWKKTVESFGFVEYSASVLEPAELYKAKSGEEIVNEQTYTFTDRGEREVTLRPEMTPSAARLVSAKEKELTFPLRWYSIPNLFRYEKPQRGRLREHWQLNVDIFGVEGNLADIEIISVAHKIMKNFGAKDEDFVIKINDRKIINKLYEKFGLDEEDSLKLSKIIDKKDKISGSAFEEALDQVLKERSKEFSALLESNQKLLEFLGKDEASDNLSKMIDELLKLDIKNIVFTPTLMRGFDYYTGMVFEVFDTDPRNNRSVFGGGRYDELTKIFGGRETPSVGFGAGDVTIKDFLETRGLLPVFKPNIKIYICTVEESFKLDALKLAERLREVNINTAIDLTNKKLGDQIKNADKQNIPYIICLGEDEVKSETYTLKNLDTGEEKKVRFDEIVSNLN